MGGKSLENPVTLNRFQTNQSSIPTQSVPQVHLHWEQNGIIDVRCSCETCHLGSAVLRQKLRVGWWLPKLRPIEATVISDPQNPGLFLRSSWGSSKEDKDHHDQATLKARCTVRCSDCEQKAGLIPMCLPMFQRTSIKNRILSLRETHVGVYLNASSIEFWSTDSVSNSLCLTPNKCKWPSRKISGFLFLPLQPSNPTTSAPPPRFSWAPKPRPWHNSVLCAARVSHPCSARVEDLGPESALKTRRFWNPAVDW